MVRRLSVLVVSLIVLSVAPSAYAQKKDDKKPIESDIEFEPDDRPRRSPGAPAPGLASAPP